MLKKAWIFAIIAYVSFIVPMALLTVLLDRSGMETVAISLTFAGMILWVVFGTLGFNALMEWRNSSEENKHKQLFLLFLLFFPSRIVWIFKTIFKTLGALSRALMNQSNQSSSSSSGSREEVIILHTPYERELRIYSEHEQDYYGTSETNPYHGKYYNRYRDDLGNFWRCYDGEHYLSEDEMRKNGMI